MSQTLTVTSPVSSRAGRRLRSDDFDDYYEVTNKEMYYSLVEEPALLKFIVWENMNNATI